jgi:putative tryptophan/tyrosine transport system substrate-binding protein
LAGYSAGATAGDAADRMLHSHTQESEAVRIAAIQEGLKEVGFVAGRNVAIEHRFADGHNERLPMLAAELVQRLSQVATT